VSRPRYVALLRAITNVPMKPFRRALEELGFTDVESYATSGNLLFNARASDPAALERRIAARVGTAASDADGSDPRPITGQKGLAAAPSSKVLGWTADGGALVVLGPGGPCGSGDAPAGVYRFDRPGVGAIMIPVPKPNGVRMWGTA
jgi:Protein of unknown function (DUF1697)